MIFAGVDIGSTTSKAVIINENEEILCYQSIMTEFNRNQSGEKVLKQALDAVSTTEDELKYVVATGYGRKAFQRADKDIPEIIAHASGTVHMYPNVGTIIDIGGQDSKIIEINEHGGVERFEMNDKCAAGTGRFFEVLTHRLLGIEMDELSELILKSNSPAEISSMCTVFAETEIISQLSQNVSVEDVAAGTACSIARRIVAQGKAGRIAFREPIIFTGGVANNKGVEEVFSNILGKKVTAIEQPQSTAALGAALRACRDYKRMNL